MFWFVQGWEPDLKHSSEFLDRPRTGMIGHLFHDLNKPHEAIDPNPQTSKPDSV